MAQKDTKKELKQPDILQTKFSEIVLFVQANRVRIMQVAGVVVLVIILSSAWYLYEWQNAKAAAVLYVKAEDALGRTGSINPVAGQKVILNYQAIINQYPRSQGAMLARYRLGGLYYQLQQLDQAIKYYDAFLKDSPADSDLATMALNGLGYAYEAKGDLKKALSSFDRAAKSPAGENFAGTNYQNIARIYEAMNDRTQALSYYQKALNSTLDPSLSRLLKRKIAILS